MVFDFLRGEFIDVISWLDDTRDTMVWRFERRGQAIKMGAKLTVREGQAAVFIHEGQLADVFGPGLYQLETNNMPIMTTLQHWDHGFQSPFQSEVYFVSTTRFNDQKWGTKNPIMARDPEFGPVRLRAFGTYTMRITDPGKFMTEIVGTDGEFTTDEVSNQIRNMIVQAASQALASSGIPVLDMAANTEDLGKVIAQAIAPKVAEYGLSIPEFYIENISLPEEVEKALDRRTSMGVVGDLNKYMQFQSAEAMGNPASGAGSAMATGAGMAMGMGMAQNMGPWGAQPAQQPAQQAPAAAAPPPPPAPGREWHLAENGATKGPYGEAQLQGLIGSGQLTRATLVWSAGMEGWKPAAETGLAPLFANVPPPLPPAL
ncbi:SPFH domain-containing protein [Pseudogemmobacter faecipullorum]|uniref:SPFH domain-containing protein n=1 Tax=Pseudogemmobacter faecipullorum TaxID=2755041 RepID=A0ABS8CLG7_9RHOB|nr:SPFH domain-containing protein [Pseudogemmobacter faecipullorum]MCB5410222.1 SPFH domain-containing protein [Pseudogemmobacter faecipullorum]